MLKSEISERTLWIVLGAIATPLFLVLVLANGLPTMPRLLAALVPLCSMYFLVQKQMPSDRPNDLSIAQREAARRRVANNTVKGAFVSLILVLAITISFALAAFAIGSYLSTVICALSTIPAMLGVRKLLA